MSPIRSCHMLAVVVAACSGSRYNQGGDLDDDTGGDVDTADADTDTDTDADADADADADTDTDADADTDTDACTNDWDPVHEAGWTRTYAAVFDGTAGTKTQSGQGAGTTSWGEAAYVYYESLSADTDGWAGQVYVDCDHGGEEGLFVLGWDMQVVLMGYSTDVTGVHSQPRKYLPPEDAVGTAGSWAYSYTLDVTTSDGTSLPVAVEGSYEEAGFEEVQLFDGTTVEAYKLANDFYMVESTSGQEIDGYGEQWWVRGLGLVRETTVDQSSGSELMSAELSGYTGLEVIED